jgi:hypothetical protein
MKAETIQVQVTFNTGHYTSVRLGGEFTATKNGYEADVKEAYAEIIKAFEALKESNKPQRLTPESNNVRDMLAKEFDLQQDADDMFITTLHPKWQFILARAKQGVTLATMKGYGYEFDTETTEKINQANELFKIIKNEVKH